MIALFLVILAALLAFALLRKLIVPIIILAAICWWIGSHSSHDGSGRTAGEMREVVSGR